MPNGSATPDRAAEDARAARAESRRMSRRPTVHPAAGEIAGTASPTGVRVFRGIPYAAPPIGALRWRPPQPAPPWSGVHDGSRFGPDPMQVPDTQAIRNSLAPALSEDCLNLNVWAPPQVPPSGAPVMVYFASGGYIAGSASRERTAGDHYAERGVVFVAVNYRVGVFGFLAHPALSAESRQGSSGNYGALDIIASLRWVREHIAAFGGDPQRVTLTGAAAGAALSGLLLTSPLARGLIDRAILRSPGSLRPMCTLAEGETAGLAVGDDLAAMRALPADALLAMNGRIDPGARNLLDRRRLRPIVDGWVFERDEADAFRSGAFAAVPTIIGGTSNEGGFFQGEAAFPNSYPARVLASQNGVRTIAQLRDYLAENFGAAAGEAWTYYGAANADDIPASIANALTDTMFSYGIRTIARAIARRQPQTFRYLFTHAGAHTANPPVNGNDTVYAFGTGDFEARDRAVSDAMLAAFAHFAATGDPNGAGAPHWAPYDPDRDNYVTFGGEFAEGTRWRAEPAEFVARVYRARSSPATRQ
jgi:para-nitrobenzyl esterase